MSTKNVLLTLTLAGCCFAQDIRTGTLVGLVSDQSGSAVPHAQVTVVNVQIKVELRALTTSDRNYYVPVLNIGEYDVKCRGERVQALRANRGDSGGRLNCAH